MIALTRRAMLATAAAVLLLMVAVAATLTQTAMADLDTAVDTGTPSPGAFYLDNGFAKLGEADPTLVGTPVSTELPGDEQGSIIQLTDTGLLYWGGPGHPVVHFDGKTRVALVGSSLVTWTSDTLDPPAPEPQPSGYVAAGVGPGAYIAAHSKYGQRAACVSRIETGGWNAFYNPHPWGGGQHAQGYFGWLPSTWFGPLSRARPEWGSVGQGGSIMNLDDEIAGFDRMLDAHRGGEFAGIASGRC